MTTVSDGGDLADGKAAADQEPAGQTKRKTRESEEIHEIRFVSYPKLLFVWPLILAGFLFWPFSYWSLDPGLLGWSYLFIATIVILTVGVDVNRNQAVFWMACIGLIWVLGLWLRDAKHFTLFGNIYNWFASLGVEYNRGFGLAFSIILSAPYLVMLIYAQMNDRWRITHNEFEHYSFGRMDDSLGRGAKTIRTSFPDVFELLLGLAGTLIIFNATGTKELRRIQHVMFLPLIRKRLNKILERTAITAAMSEAEEDDDDDY